MIGLKKYSIELFICLVVLMSITMPVYILFGGTIYDDTTIEGDVTISASSTSSGDLSVAGDSAITGNETVGGDSTVTGTVQGGTVTDGTMTCTAGVMSLSKITATTWVYSADQVYGDEWNSELSVPTKNAVYDKIETLVGLFEIDINGDLEPISGTESDQYCELDGNDDIQPKAI